MFEKGAEDSKEAGSSVHVESRRGVNDNDRPNGNVAQARAVKRFKVEAERREEEYLVSSDEEELMGLISQICACSASSSRRNARYSELVSPSAAAAIAFVSAALIFLAYLYM